MKKWAIPAKTFLLGEYAALANKGAIVLTTHPCFEVTLTETNGLHGIHPDSPAGRWWNKMGHDQYGLHWYDPFNHCGGMGASSAQFLGAYFASSYINATTPTQAEILEAYWQCAWQDQGIRPSGYDVIAQSLSGCVSINRDEHHCEVFPWSFSDLAFIIVHTGHKLATHHHLQDMTLSDDVDQLNAIVTLAKHAFLSSDSQALVNAVNAYHHALVLTNRVDQNTVQLLDQLTDLPGLLAMKGCGAMGADVIILITTRESVATIQSHLRTMQLSIMATNEGVFTSDLASNSPRHILRSR